MNFLSQILRIVVIDLVLSGDNAVVDAVAIVADKQIAAKNQRDPP